METQYKELEKLIQSYKKGKSCKNFKKEYLEFIKQEDSIDPNMLFRPIEQQIKQYEIWKQTK